MPLRIGHVLKELGFEQPGPTALCCDSQSAINMVNARVPAERSRHTDVQHFAMQDWKESGDVIMSFMPGITDPMGPVGPVGSTGISVGPVGSVDALVGLKRVPCLL